MSLAELFAMVAPPAGDEGPMPRPRVASPGNRRATIDRLERGRVARAEGRLLRAITDLREAARLDPASVAARRELARSYELIGNDDLARRSWQDVAGLRPRDPEAAVALAAIWLAEGRPLEAVAFLRPRSADEARTLAAADEAGAADARDEIADVYAWARNLLLLDACETLGAHAAAAEVGAGLLAAPPDDVSRRVAAVRGVRETAAGVARRLGDAELALGRGDAARAGYARGVSELETTFADVRTERAILLVRRVHLELTEGRLMAAWSCLRGAANADSRGAAPAIVGLSLVAAEVPRSDSPAFAALAALAFRLDIDVIAAATDTAEVLPTEPAAGQAAMADQVRMSGPPWPHPLPEARTAAARVLRQLDRPLSKASAIEPPSPAVSAMAIEATGWLGRAWSVLDAAPAEADPYRTAVARVRLAGLLQDRRAVGQAVAAGLAVGLWDPAFSVVPVPRGPVPLGGRAIDATAMAASPTPAWRATFGMATVTALARTDQTNAAVALARGLLASFGADADIADAAATVPAGVRSALRLTLAAACAERAWTSAPSPQRRQDLRTAIDIAAATVEARPGDAVAWRLLDALIGPTGPIADPAARLRHRRRWVADTAGSSDAASLQREQRLTAGRFEEADLAARLRLLIDPDDPAPIEDVVAARSRAGRPELAAAWIDAWLDRHPAEPLGAALRLRVAANLGESEAAWARLEARLDQDGGDLVALRLAESAAGFAGDRMMRLVMGEARLLERPEGPHRALLLARLAIEAEQERDAVRAATAFISGLADASPRDVQGISGLLRQLSRDRPDVAIAADLADIALATELAAGRAFSDAPVARGLAAAARRAPLAAPTLALVDAFAQNSAAVLAADRANPGAVVEPWRTLATDLVDGGHADRAALLVARRIVAGRDVDDQLEGLVSLFVALDAATEAARDAAGDVRPPTGVVPLRDPVVLRLSASRWRELVGLSRSTGPADEALAPADRTRSLLEHLSSQSRLRDYAARDGSGDAERPDAPVMAIALRRAAGVYRLVGAIDAADGLLSDALSLWPDDPTMLNDAGYTWLVASGGHDATAAAMIERAHAQRPGEPSVLDSLGWSRYLAGEPGAIELLERAVAGDPRPSGEVLLHLGDALWREGRREEAETAWRRGVATAGTARHRTDTEQQLQALQIGIWGVLVRDPGSLYDALFGPVGDGLRERLTAIGRGADAEPPITPTAAERTPDH